MENNTKTDPLGDGVILFISDESCTIKHDLTSLSLVTQERHKQLKIGYTLDSDKHYSQNQLLLYSSYWSSPESYEHVRKDIEDLLKEMYSYGWPDSCFNYGDKTPVQRLTIAAALICAEIDRIS